MRPSMQVYKIQYKHMTVQNIGFYNYISGCKTLTKHFRVTNIPTGAVVLIISILKDQAALNESGLRLRQVH